MTSAAIREQLHHYIDVANEDQIAAIYDIMTNEAAGQKYTPAELTEFYNRLERYEKGETPTYSVEEAHDHIRRYKKDK